MDSFECGRSNTKHEVDDNSDMNSDRGRDDEGLEIDGKRKRRSSKSRKVGNGEEAVGLDSSGMRRSSGERNESRKRLSGSSQAGSDEDDYDMRKESHSKQTKRKQEESSLDKLSNWYQEGELENKHDGGGRSGGRAHGRADESERRNSTSNFDPRSGKSSDPKHESARERPVSSRIEPSERKITGLEANSDMGWKSYTREDVSLDAENFDNHRQQRNPTGHDLAESFNTDKDGNTWTTGKSKREVEWSNRERTPEKSVRRNLESENSKIDKERSIAFTRKELENDTYMDDRSKGKDDSWGERNRNRESSKDMWKRGQNSNNEKETKDGDITYNHGREWELQRHGHERTDNQSFSGRSGGRKDGRSEAVKTSSNYGISNKNYDVIEIQTKPFNHEKGDSGSTFSRRNEVGQQSDVQLARNDEYGSGPSGDVSKDRFLDYGSAPRDENSWRDDMDTHGGKGRGQKGVLPNRSSGGQISSRVGRGGRGKPGGRDSQQFGIPVPMMGPPFGPLGMPPPGPMHPLTPSMSPGPGPPISLGVFIPPFSPPVMWPGAQGVEMNMLAVPPSLSPIPPGPSGPRFFPNLGTLPNTALYYNQPGPGRGAPPNVSDPGFNAIAPPRQGQLQEKSHGGWVHPKINGPAGKAPSRGEQNDYSQNFVDSGMRPQNFIRELELTNVVEDYPKLRELIQKKDEIVVNSASPPMYYKCDLKEHVLSPEFFGTKFDVILVDPPWEEYVHRAPGVTDHMEYWSFEEIMNLKIEAIADTPSFIFLWVGDGVGLEQGRQCLKKWGFRRCEDICWVKTNKTNPTPGLRHDSHTLFQHSKEHCLMGIKGTVRRSTDGHIIHANIDTDVIIAEEPPYGSTEKPEDMYRIIEHFSLGRRRLELFGEDHNIQSGWLTVGKGLSSTNFNAEAYVRNFADKDGKVWQGGGGRNPPPDAPHLVVTTPDIEALRPKSPMKNQQ